MISFDRSLAGERGTDAVERHRKYAEFLDMLTIVVVTPPGTYPHLPLGDRVEVYPTRALTLWGHVQAIFGYFYSLRAHEGIDLIVAQDLAAPVAYLLKQLTGTPLIVSVHGVWWDAWFSARRWWHRFYLPIFAWSVRRADTVRVVSSHMARLLREKGVEKSRIEIIPVPVALERYAVRDEEKIRQLQLQHEFPIVLSVGRLSPEKGIAALLRAWKGVIASGLKSCLLIIGEGSERKRLEQLAQDLIKDGSVKFLGQIAPDDLPPYYQAAALCVLASESESFGKVLVEAGAAGLPCVATATAGASEIIQHEKTGYLVPVGDTANMATYIAALLKDALRAKEMGSAARTRVVKEYDGEKNVHRIIALWERVGKRTKN